MAYQAQAPAEGNNFGTIIKVALLALAGFLLMQVFAAPIVVRIAEQAPTEAPDLVGEVAEAATTVFWWNCWNHPEGKVLDHIEWCHSSEDNEDAWGNSKFFEKSAEGLQKVVEEAGRHLGDASRAVRTLGKNLKNNEKFAVRIGRKIGKYRDNAGRWKETEWVQLVFKYAQDGRKILINSYPCGAPTPPPAF